MRLAITFQQFIHVILIGRLFFFFSFFPLHSLYSYGVGRMVLAIWHVIWFIWLSLGDIVCVIGIPCRCMPVSRWSCAVYTRPVGSMIGSLPCFLLLLFLLSFWVVFRFCSWFLADVNLLVACVPKLSHAVEEYFCHSQFILEQVKRHGVYF